MLNDAQKQAVSAYAEGRIAMELERYRNRHNGAERLAAITPEQMTEWKQGMHDDAAETAERWLTDARYLYDRFRNGLFHPDNRNSRKLLSGLFGVSLPTKRAELRDVIRRDVIGCELFDSFVADDEREAAEKEAAEAAREAAAERKRVARLLSAAVPKIVAGEPIHGSDLAEIAGLLGVVLHPRTIGTLRQRIGSINASQARVSATGSRRFTCPGTAYECYRTVRSLLLL